MGLEPHEHFEAVLLCCVFFSAFCNSFIDDKMIIKNVHRQKYKKVNLNKLNQGDYINISRTIRLNYNLCFRCSISEECFSLLLILLRLDTAFDELCEIDFAFLLVVINQSYSLDIMIPVHIG